MMLDINVLIIDCRLRHLGGYIDKRYAIQSLLRCRFKQRYREPIRLQEWQFRAFGGWCQASQLSVQGVYLFIVYVSQSD